MVANCLQNNLPKGCSSGTSSRTVNNAVMVRICMNLREIFREANLVRPTGPACGALAHTCHMQNRLKGHPSQEVVQRRLLRWSLEQLGVFEEFKSLSDLSEEVI